MESKKKKALAVLGIGAMTVGLIIALTRKAEAAEPPIPPPPVGQFNLTVNATAGGSVSPSGTHSYAIGSIVNIRATPAQGWHFTNWSGDVANPSYVSTTATMNGNKIITANFVQDAVPPTGYFWGYGGGWVWFLSEASPYYNTQLRWRPNTVPVGLFFTIAPELGLGEQIGDLPAYNIQVNANNTYDRGSLIGTGKRLLAL